MKIELKKYKYHVKPYGGIVSFVATTRLKYIYDKYEIKEKYDPADEKSLECQVIDHRTPKGRQKIYVIFLVNNLNRNRYKMINTLGHELRHIVNNIAIYRGLTLDKYQDEHMSYLQGDMLEKMYKFVEEYIKW